MILMEPEILNPDFFEDPPADMQDLGGLTEDKEVAGTLMYVTGGTLGEAKDKAFAVYNFGGPASRPARTRPESKDMTRS